MTLSLNELREHYAEPGVFDAMDAIILFKAKKYPQALTAAFDAYSDAIGLSAGGHGRLDQIDEAIVEDIIEASSRVFDAIILLYTDDKLPKGINRKLANLYRRLEERF